MSVGRACPGKAFIMRNKNSTVGILIALLAVLIMGGAYLFTRNPADDVGTVSGYVQDSVTGIPIRGVDVTPIDEEGEKYTSHDNSDTTGQDGYFEVELPPGQYKLLFEADGYQSFETSENYTVKSDESNDISRAFVLEALSVEPAAQPADATQPSEPVQPADATQPSEPVQPADATQPSEPVQSGQNQAETASLFTIDPGQEEDYSLNLVPEQYRSYYSDTSGFFFSYPPNLYNSVRSSFDRVSTPLGTNIESHTFTGTGGSSLTFSLYQRNDNLNLSAAKDAALAAEGTEITSSRKVLLDEYEKSAGFSRAVVTGYNSAGKIIYKLIKITPSNEMEMRIECSPYRNEDDKLMKRYVQECIYRWCGFASEKPGPPRSYADYIKSDKK